MTLPFTGHTMIDIVKPQSPPLDEIQLLVDVLDFHHRHNATRPYAIWSSNSGVTSLSWMEYARGTHRLAKAFSSAIPRRRSDSEVIALLLVCDTLMYTSTILGLLRAGFSVRHHKRSLDVYLFIVIAILLQPFPISPRESPAAVSVTRIYARILLISWIGFKLAEENFLSSNHSNVVRAQFPVESCHREPAGREL
jgi:hypothetical protein